MTFKREEGFTGSGVLTADYSSDAFEAGSFTSLSIQTVIANTDAYGILKVQGSNSPDAGWADIAFVDENGNIKEGYDVLAGYNVNHIFDASDIGVGWVRLHYDRYSGTSTDNALTWYVHKKK